MDGFFRIAFTGTAGSGFGVLVLHSGVIVGADVGGATYDGSYTENTTTQAIDFQITMNAPAGITLVQTGIALTAPLSMPITGSLSPGNINSETPSLLHTPLGPVNILFNKIRDFP
jgi:hypothetical protein